MACGGVEVGRDGDRADRGRGLNALYRSVPALVYAALLLLPLTLLAWNGSTLTGLYEESLGYRYFYTLRTLFEHQYLFLPQGELANLIFKAIHLGLSAAGHPATELHPRIGLFGYAGVALLHLIAAACFAWSTIPIASLTGRLLAALAWGGMYYLPGTSGSYHISQPDYLLLLPAGSLLTVGVILRAKTAVDWSSSRLMGLASFVGAALSVKLTLAILPAVALLHSLIQSRRPVAGVAWSIAATVLGCGIWLAILLVDMRGRGTYVSHHFEDLFAFMQSSPGVAPNSLGWLEWIGTRIAAGPALASAIYAGPFLGAACILFARRRWEYAATCSFAVGLCAYSYFLFHRDYPITVLESLFPLAGALTVASQFRIFETAVYSKWLGISLAVVAIIASFPRGVGVLIEATKINTQEQRVLMDAEREVRGKSLWLVESNAFRPLSIDSAIMKGGYAGEPAWLSPPSKIMAAMFPNRDFRFGNAKPVDLAQYGAVFFTYIGNRQEKINQLSRFYSIELSRLACDDVASLATYAVARCSPPP